jgi:hypothetical protein
MGPQGPVGAKAEKPAVFARQAFLHGQSESLFAVAVPSSRHLDAPALHAVAHGDLDDARAWRDEGSG